MIIPTSFFGIAAVVALVIPGLVYAAVRTTLQGFGPADQSVTGRIVQAVMISVLLDSAYLIAFGRWLFEFLPRDAVSIPHPRLLGVAVFTLGILAPALGAYLRYGQARWVSRITASASEILTHRLAWAVPATGYRASPTAWDWIAPKKAFKWVRVLNKQGRWVGGWATEDTFFSSYPEPRDLYIPEQWNLDDDGKFLSRTESTSGVWLSLIDAQVVEWIDPEGNEEGHIDG